MFGWSGFWGPGIYEPHVNGDLEAYGPGIGMLNSLGIGFFFQKQCLKDRIRISHSKIPALVERPIFFVHDQEF